MLAREIEFPGENPRGSAMKRNRFSGPMAHKGGNGWTRNAREMRVSNNRTYPDISGIKRDPAFRDRDRDREISRRRRRRRCRDPRAKRQSISRKVWRIFEEASPQARRISQRRGDRRQIVPAVRRNLTDWVKLNSPRYKGNNFPNRWGRFDPKFSRSFKMQMTAPFKISSAEISRETGSARQCHFRRALTSFGERTGKNKKCKIHCPLTLILLPFPSSLSLSRSLYGDNNYARHEQIPSGMVWNGSVSGVPLWISK